MLICFVRGLKFITGVGGEDMFFSRGHVDLCKEFVLWTLQGAMAMPVLSAVTSVLQLSVITNASCPVPVSSLFFSFFIFVFPSCLIVIVALRQIFP